MRWHRVGAALVAALTTIVSACSVLRIDVDVYKGPLANEPTVQDQILPIMLTSAKTELLRLRNQLDSTIPRERQTGFIQGYLRSTPTPGGPRSDSSKNENVLTDAQVLARAVNDLLSLYEDAVAPHLRPYLTVVSERVPIYAAATRDLGGLPDSSIWPRWRKAMIVATGTNFLGPCQQGFSDYFDANYAKSHSRTASQLPTACSQSIGHNGALSDEERKYATFPTDDSSSNQIYAKLEDSRFVEFYRRTLFVSASSPEALEFAAKVTQKARSFRIAREQLHAVWIAASQALQSDSYHKYQGRPLPPPFEHDPVEYKLATLIARLTDVGYLLGEFCREQTEGQQVSSLLGLLAQDTATADAAQLWNTHNFSKLVPQGERAADRAAEPFKHARIDLRDALSRDPQLVVPLLIEADEGFQSAEKVKPACDYYNRPNEKDPVQDSMQRRRYGVLDGPLVTDQELADAEDLSMRNVSAGALTDLSRSIPGTSLEGFEDGRLPEGLSSIVDGYLLQLRNGNLDSDTPEAAAQRLRLRTAAVQFAEKLLLLTNTNQLFSSSSKQSANVNVEDPGELKRHKAEAEGSVPILQAIANGILVQAQELEAYTAYTTAGARDAPADLSLANAAAGEGAIYYLNQVLVQLNTPPMTVTISTTGTPSVADNAAAGANTSVAPKSPKTPKSGKTVKATTAPEADSPAAGAAAKPATSQPSVASASITAGSAVISAAAADTAAPATSPSKPAASNPATNSTATAVKSSPPTPTPSPAPAVTANTIKTNADVETAQKAYEAAVAAAKKANDDVSQSRSAYAVLTDPVQMAAFQPKVSQANARSPSAICDAVVAWLTASIANPPGGKLNKDWAAAEQYLRRTTYPSTLYGDSLTAYAELIKLVRKAEDAAPAAKKAADQAQVATADELKQAKALVAKNPQVAPAPQDKTTTDPCSPKTYSKADASEAIQSAVAPLLEELGTHGLTSSGMSAYVSLLQSMNEGCHGKSGGGTITKEKYGAALAFLSGHPASSGSSIPLPDATLGTRTSSIDRLITSLQYQQIEALRVGNDDGEKSLTAALQAAYNYRASLVYIRPASAYLRSAYPASVYQQESFVGWQNLLADEGRRSSPFFSESLVNKTGYLNFNADQTKRQLIAAEENDRQSWQNINSVKVSGTALTNYVVTKDDVGNWYVKAYSSDPSKVIEAATKLAQFNLGVASSALAAKAPAKTTSTASDTANVVAGKNAPPTNTNATASSGAAAGKSTPVATGVQAIVNSYKSHYQTSTNNDLDRVLKLDAEWQSAIKQAWAANGTLTSSANAAAYAQFQTSLASASSELKGKLAPLQLPTDATKAAQVDRSAEILAALQAVNQSYQFLKALLVDAKQDDTATKTAAALAARATRNLLVGLVTSRQATVKTYSAAVTVLGQSN